MATTLTSKGQVTVPKKLRDYLGIGPGSAVEFELSATGQVLLRPLKTGKARIRSRFAKLRGTATVRMTTEEIMAMTRGDV
jgi:AbrB family looped-hinge helix DNA binding protein